MAAPLKNINSLIRSTFAEHRTITGAPVSADNADLTVAFFKDLGLLQTQKWDSILVAAVLTAPGAATVEVEWLFWDTDAELFYRIDGATTYTLNGSEAVEVKTFQMPGVLRVVGATGNPTVVKLRVAPGLSSGMN